MKSEEIVKKYLTTCRNYIRPNTEIDYRNKELLFKILQYWKQLTKKNTIGNLNERQVLGNTQLIKMKNGNEVVYYINADSSKVGVIEFLNNKENAWRVIPNQNGVLNNVTNKENEERIRYFYIYKN